MQNVAMFLHLLGAFLFVAGIVLVGTVFETARRRSRAAEVALLLGLARFAVPLVAGGALLAGVFGLWLVHLGHWGYGSGWVDTSIVLYAVALALGSVGGHRPRHARVLAAELARADAPVSDELRALLDDPGSRAANYASAAVVLALVAVMVFKP
ncbi:MAG: DUF2269 family protein [Solirubrobacteraceae bacterium]